MKRSLLAFILLLSLSSPMLAQSSHPTPAGIRQAEQADAQSQRDIPPPALAPKANLDYAKLRSEAEQLAALAQSIPPGVDQALNGVLPRDLGEKLKQVEKLAKNLRRQLSP